MVTMSKRVYVDLVVNATGAEAAIAQAHYAADYTTLEHALEAGIVGFETDWGFERVEVEGDDDPPSAMAVAA